jgi:V/A-type H+-transporting ATPase subunit D
MNVTGQATTRAAVLELMNEQVVVKEAYVFLDEKRLLLASELLRQLAIFQQVQSELDEIQARARKAMRAALMHHGLNGLQVYPATSLDGADFRQQTCNFMGVKLVETELNTDNVTTTHALPSNPSSAAELCSYLFREMVVKNARLSGVSGNLYRLLEEYRLTERRARALENVILPEIEQSLRDMSAHLEELDLEDAIRVRLQSTVMA